MPLSEEEQRVLDQLERDLGADPVLGKVMAKKPRQRGRIVLGAFGVIIGLTVVLSGAMFNIVPLGIGGFALMIVSALWVLFAPQGKAAPVTKSRSGSTSSSKKSLMSRVEDRFEERRERGEF